MLPNINPLEPTIVPAKTYDQFWVEEIVIHAPDPNGDAIARVRLKKFGVFDGKAEFMPGGEFVNLTINDLLSKSNEDNDLANVVESLLLYIKKAGIEQGIVAPPPSGV